MNENKFSNEAPEQVIIYPDTHIIEINGACEQKAYGLFDSQTGTQVSDFIKGTSGKVEFKKLDPLRHYDVGTIENTGEEKPNFAINWTNGMRDDTDDILNNSRNLPVKYPYIYRIINNENNSDNVFDLVDNNTKKVGEVINLTQSGDKPQFTYVHSFKMADDTKK